MWNWVRWLVVTVEWSLRGSRYPAGAHTVAVSLRVDCAAVLGLGSAPRNSLRSLCSLRSDNRGENVYEVRCAHRPQPCAPRRHRVSPRRVPTPAREVAWSLFPPTPTTVPQRCARVGCGAPLQRRGAQLSRLRAQRASSTLSSRLSERRERSEQSEFRDAAVKASTAGQSTRSATAAVARRSPPGHTFAASTPECNAPAVPRTQQTPYQPGNPITRPTYFGTGRALCCDVIACTSGDTDAANGAERRTGTSMFSHICSLLAARCPPAKARYPKKVPVLTLN